jgi:hypothetical protein
MGTARNPTESWLLNAAMCTNSLTLAPGLEQRLDHEPVFARAAIGGLNQAFEGLATAAWSVADALRVDGHGWKALAKEDPLGTELHLLCRDDVALIERTALINQLQLSLITPPKGIGGGGIYFPSIVTVALGEPGVPDLVDGKAQISEKELQTCLTEPCVNRRNMQKNP